MTSSNAIPVFHSRRPGNNPVQRLVSTAPLLALFFLGCGQKQDAAELAAPATVAQNRRPVPVLERAPETGTEAFVITGKVESKLPIYEIRMGPSDLEALEGNPYSNDLHPATFTAEGVTYENVKIRFRGAWARTWPKKALKLFFNEDKPFKGQRRLNLNAGWRDPAFIRETLAYHIFEKSGAVASKSHLARVHLNGQFRGLYVAVEQPDKAFLKERGLKGATIFKASSRMKQGDERDFGSEAAFRQHYEQETQKDEPGSFAELQRFCAELARAKDVVEFFNRRVDLDKYVNYLAANILCQNWDQFNKNHFLVYDGANSKKWFALPWDLDRTLGDHWDWSFDSVTLPIASGTQQAPAITGWNRLQDRFFSHPVLRARLADRLQELLEKEFTTEKLYPVIDQMAAQIAPEAEMDRQRWPAQYSDVQEGIQGVKTFIRERRAFLLRELPRFRKQ
jgi:spore coat protein H